MTIKKVISETAVMLLILLFVYASVSKLMDFTTFQTQMVRQPLPNWMSALLSWTLLPVELITAGLLVFKFTRKIGLYFSLSLMVAFTGYVALALAGVLGSIPCVCGGVMESLNWKSHLVFNVVYTVIALLGISTNSYAPTSDKKIKLNRTPPWKPRRGSGDVPT